MLRLTVIFSLILLANAAGAEIYKGKDKRGNTIYSDSPFPGSEAIDLPTINSTPAVPPRERPVSQDSPEPTMMDNKITITSPRDGQVFPNGRIPITVTARTESPMIPGQVVVFAIDGKVVQRGALTHLRIPLMQRGPHQISASLYTSNEQLISSHTINVVAHWPSNN